MVTFESKDFDSLSTLELHQIFALRNEVFIVEQNCIYQDIDGKDLDATHILGYLGKEIIAYARILKKGCAYDEYAAIGRIVVSPKRRGQNIGHELVEKSIQWARLIHPNERIKISAQEHLVPFYTTHGFRSVGEGYLEDGIPHIAMILDQ